MLGRSGCDPAGPDTVRAACCWTGGREEEGGGVGGRPEMEGRVKEHYSSARNKIE